MIGLLAVISGFNTLGASNQMFSTNEALTDQKTVTTQEAVSVYFADIPIMVDIAKCESRFRHTDKDGNVSRGEVNKFDVGVMQINEKYHLEESKKLGYDIHTLEGNMAYARYLYEKQGARPWLASSKCWSQYQNIAKK